MGNKKWINSKLSLRDRDTNNQNKVTWEKLQKRSEVQCTRAQCAQTDPSQGRVKTPVAEARCRDRGEGEEVRQGIPD